jgi:hypothetical protein
VYCKIVHPGTALALEEIEQKTERGGDIMKAPNKTATICQWVTDPTDTCLGQTRARVAEVMVTEPIPGRIYVPAGGVATRVRKVPERIVKYEKRGPVGVITARVQNIGEAYDEIDALLDRIEQDKEVQVVAIYTLDGLFASLPIR